MRVLITFKVGDDKGWNHTRHFDLDLAESETLKRDFLAHVNGGIGALSGASYRCIDPDTGQSRELAIRFSDILYAEFMPQTGVTLTLIPKVRLLASRSAGRFRRASVRRLYSTEM